MNPAAHLRELFRFGWILRERREHVELQRDANELRFEDSTEEVVDEVGVSERRSLSHPS